MRTAATLLLLVLTAWTSLGSATQEPSFNGRTMSEWQAMLREDPTPRKRRAAVVALGQIAEMNRETVPVALAAVGRALKSDASPAVREQAANVLATQRVDEKSAVVIPDLVESLRIDRETPVRRAVAVALGRFGGYAKSAVKPLTAALRDQDAGVRAAAADALGRVGGESATALPELLLLLKDSDKSVRQAAIFAVGRIEPEDREPASKALVAVLKSETDPALRREAVLSLGFLGDQSEEVVKSLAAVLADKDASLRALVALTLGKFGSAVKQVEAELVKALTSDPDKAVRLNLVRTLSAGRGNELDRLVAVLIPRLKDDPDFEVRVAIAEELGALGRDGKVAIPALRLAQRDPQIKVREAATAAIRAIERQSSKSKS